MAASRRAAISAQVNPANAASRSPARRTNNQISAFSKDIGLSSSIRRRNDWRQTDGAGFVPSNIDGQFVFGVTGRGKFVLVLAAAVGAGTAGAADSPGSARSSTGSLRSM